MEHFVEIVNVVLNLVIAGFAGNQLADTWIMGSIFERPQKWLKQRAKTSKTAKLLSCLFCMQHWTTLLCLLALLLTGWESLSRLPVYWFAAVKVAVLTQREEEVALDQTSEVDSIEVMDDEPVR